MKTRTNKLLTVAFVAFGCLGSSVIAESLLVEYYAAIGDVDLKNSRGVPLQGTCAILQQDRANVNSLGKSQSGDNRDPYFTTPERRAELASACRKAGGFPFVVETINTYGGILVWVLVYENGGQISRVVVRNGAG